MSILTIVIDFSQALPPPSSLRFSAGGEHARNKNKKRPPPYGYREKEQDCTDAGQLRRAAV